jgi:dTDP-4-amino-4,6-dideoxygalactose transaminase
VNGRRTALTEPLVDSRIVDPTAGAIPLNRTAPVGKERDYIEAAISEAHIGGDGPFGRCCEAFLEQELGAVRVLLTTSCTHSLELAAMLLDLEPGDEVIVPSFTFVSTVNAFVREGCVPVFADIRADTCNIDTNQLPSLMTPRTRAIVPVHYAGIPCDMDALTAIAEEHGATIVEDAAHALFASYRGGPAGTFGDFATFSFHESKNFTCGEGGALVVNKPEHVARAEIMREKGTNRAAFFRGEVDKYTWVDTGSSYVLSDLLAAHLWGQLERYADVQAAREQIWRAYSNRLGDWAKEHGVQLPSVPENVVAGYHLFYIVLPTLDHRTRLIAHLKQSGVGSAFHYVPLHSSPMGARYGYEPGDCPVTEDISARLLRLPFFNAMTERELDTVCATVESFEFNR